MTVEYPVIWVHNADPRGQRVYMVQRDNEDSVLVGIGGREEVFKLKVMLEGNTPLVIRAMMEQELETSDEITKDYLRCEAECKVLRKGLGLD